jgi:hypothetical protein
MKNQFGKDMRDGTNSFKQRNKIISWDSYLNIITVTNTCLGQFSEKQNLSTTANFMELGTSHMFEL